MLRIIFKDGNVMDCENVARIFMDTPEEAYIRANISPILREEYARGFKDGYKTGVVDYETKHKGVEDIMGDQQE